MPSGKTHERLQIAATPILTVSAVVGVVAFGVEMPKALIIVLGAFIGSALSIIFTPDLIDVDGDTLPEHHIRKVPGIGWLVAGVYDIISRTIPHRGISHVPVIGTFITVGWFVPFLFIFPHITAWTVAWKCVADLVHIGADLITTPIKRDVNRRRRGEF